ncbi:hypothetical protein [Streptococcus sp. NLN64]|uniref:hypothetical protein n=1 Tax=Streptococcus sp. NLN64 TaxID=2822799 RepID=UPI0018CBA1F5|nr:hypothetical protein [Streptococcus sp. NLN64]MBG9367333.1 hypothetical protein [Streptococcus sp. NLN64]
MEVMAIPNRETVIFHRQIRPWIVAGEMNHGVIHYTFSQDTPDKIIDLFQTVRDKLSYPCVAVSN